MGFTIRKLREEAIKRQLSTPEPSNKETTVKPSTQKSKRGRKKRVAGEKKGE